MNIGIIGSGNMGASMGKAWAAKGHKVLFSFSKDQNKPQAVADDAGPNARTGTPAEGVAFGDVVLLAVPWAAVTEALKAAGPIRGKVLFSCCNCLKPDFSGLVLGTTTSAAEEIARLSPEAKVVEALPPMAQILAADSHRLAGQQISTFYCGDDAGAKATVAKLLADLDLEAVDAGPLTSARYIEPAGMLNVQLAYGMGLGPNVGMKLLRYERSSVKNGNARPVADLAEGHLLASVEIAAPPERVFRALASDEIVGWWVRPGVFDTREWAGDVRVGGHWRVSGLANGQPYVLEGEFLEIDPPRKLVHTYHRVGVPGATTTTVTYLLERLDGGTRITLRHLGFTSRESCTRNCLAWETCFERLAESIATEQLVSPPA